MLKNINKYLHTPTWLFILLLVVLVFRIPTFFEPYSYGDEMIYLTLGEAVRKGIPLYKGIHDNKPPMLYLTAAVAGSLFWFRAILAIWHLVTVFIFWKFVQTLFPKNTKLQKIATVVFAILTTIPLLEGNIANSEMFMIGPTMLAFIILLKKKFSATALLGAGVLFSIGTLYKIPAAFDVPTIVFYWIAATKLTWKNVLKITKRTVILSIGYLLPIFATFIWYYSQGAFTEYFVAAFGQNVGYLSSFRPDDVREPFLTRNGPLLGRGVGVLVGLLILFVFRKKLSKQFIFITAWLFLTIFAVTLSERPYPHYLIQSVPALAVMVGMLFTLKTIEQSLVIIPLAIFLIGPVYYKFWYYPSIPYYARFINFATGKISADEYRSSFGGNVTVNYKIADHVKRHTKSDDKIFVWGDNGTIYALTRKLPPIKYVADYHISDFSSPEITVQQLQDDLPEMIIILPTSQHFPKLRQLVQTKYGISTTINGAQVWKLLSPNIRAFMTP